MPLMYICILLLIVAFPPNHTARPRVLVAIILLLLAAVGVATCLISALLPCSTPALALAQAYSVAAGAMVVVAFTPQLYETCGIVL